MPYSFVIQISELKPVNGNWGKELMKESGKNNAERVYVASTRTLKKKKKEFETWVAVTNSGIQIEQFVENTTKCGLNSLHFLLIKDIILMVIVWGLSLSIEQSRAE